MHWTLNANLEAICAGMRLAKDQGADVCAFSELAVTDFHRQIASVATPALVAPAIQSIQKLSSHLKLAVAVGAPTFCKAGLKYITHLLIDAGGSGVVSPEGELLFRQPKEAFGIGVFVLGERTFDWRAQ